VVVGLVRRCKNDAIYHYDCIYLQLPLAYSFRCHAFRRFLLRIELGWEDWGRLPALECDDGVVGLNHVLLGRLESYIVWSRRLAVQSMCQGGVICAYRRPRHP